MNGTGADSRKGSWITSTPFYYGWVILVVAGITHFTSAPGQTYVVSIFLEPMIDDMGWSRTIFSGLYTAGSMTAALFMVAVGKALDRFGARKTLAILCVLMGFAAIWMSGVDAKWKLYVGFAALRTIGQGSFGLVATTMISTWFVRMRGRATALSSLGGAASMTAFPFVVHLLIESLGWRQAWTTLGISVWVLLLVPVIVLIRRSPEDIGVLPDGDQIHKSSEKISGSERIPAIENELLGKSASEPSEIHFKLSEALRTRSLWMLVFSSIALPLIMTGLMFHHVSILGSKGLSPALAAGTMGLFGPLMLVANLGGGYLSDRMPNRFLLAAGQAILVITMLWAMTIETAWQAVFYIVLASLSVGLVGTTNTVIWANYFGRRYLGSIRGFATTIMVAFSAMGALPFGIIYDRSESYDTAILILLVLPVFACIFSLLALPPQRYTKSIESSINVP